MKFDYSGGVLEHERATIERFEDEVLPFLVKHGGRIGETAVQGDLDAEEIVRRYAMFVNGMPHLRTANLRQCVAALKRWDTRHRQ